MNLQDFKIKLQWYNDNVRSLLLTNPYKIPITNSEGKIILKFEIAKSKTDNSYQANYNGYEDVLPIYREVLNKEIDKLNQILETPNDYSKKIEFVKNAYKKGFVTIRNRNLKFIGSDKFLEEFPSSIGTQTPLEGVELNIYPKDDKEQQILIDSVKQFIEQQEPKGVPYIIKTSDGKSNFTIIENVGTSDSLKKVFLNKYESSKRKTLVLKKWKEAHFFKELENGTLDISRVYRQSGTGGFSLSSPFNIKTPQFFFNLLFADEIMDFQEWIENEQLPTQQSQKPKPEPKETELSERIKKHFDFFNRNCPRKHKQILNDADFEKLIEWAVSYYNNGFKVPEISQPIKVINTNKTFVQLAFKYLFKELNKSSPYPETLFEFYQSAFNPYSEDKKSNFEAVKNNDEVKKLMQIDY